MKDTLIAVSCILLVVVILAVFVGAMYSAVIQGITEDLCAAKGWRDSKVTITFQRYCINRTDQTDIIKPLSEIR